MKMNEKREVLYFVTVVETLLDDEGEEQYRGSRCWGYYRELNDAITAIIENHTDIHECSYDYAVIEAVPEGVLPLDMEEVKWFNWNLALDKYEEMDSRPKALCNIRHWSVG